MAGPFSAADDAGGPGRAQLDELEEKLEELKKATEGPKAWLKTDAKADSL